MKLYGQYSNVFGLGTADEKDFAVALDIRPPSFFEQHVKNLCLTGTVSDKYTQRVLSICTGVQNLAVWNPALHPGQITTLPLRSLDTSIETIRALSELRQIFPELIYLSIICFSNDEDMPRLEWLPALTHVRLEVGRYSDPILEYLKTILRTCECLQSIVIQIDNSDGRYDSREQVEVWAEEDSRITITEHSGSNYVRDWEERIADIDVGRPLKAT